MTHLNLTVEVQGVHILVAPSRHLFQGEIPETRSSLGPTDECGPDDPGATIFLSEFRNLAWAAANESAQRFIGTGCDPDALYPSGNDPCALYSPGVQAPYQKCCRRSHAPLPRNRISVLRQV
jgi:hypothetical protein